MTAIVALKTPTSVVMGGDSAAAGHSGWNLVLRKDPKVFRVGPFLIGYTTSFRMGQLLRYGERTHSLQTLKPAGDPFRFMVRNFVPQIREIFKAGGYMTVKDNAETGGMFLVAWGSHLFGIDYDLHVEHPRDDYAAYGCGDVIALGSLYSSEGTPRVRVRLALEAAEHFSAGVRRPFTILETRPRKGQK